MNRDHLFKNQEALITTVIEFFFAPVLQKDHFDKVVAICLEAKGNRSAGEIALIKSARFTLSDFLVYWGKLQPPGNNQIHITVVEELLRRFCDWHLLTKSELFRTNKWSFYQVNEGMAKYFVARDALENLAFDYFHLVEKYSPAVLRLVATNPKGDESNGTGFLFMTSTYVLTNKHVVERDQNSRPRVIDQSGRELAILDVRTAPRNDIALIRLQTPHNSRPFFFAPSIDVLDEVVTMGFPRIPLSRSAPMVVHRGEINGKAPFQEGERLNLLSENRPWK